MREIEWYPETEANISTIGNGSLTALDSILHLRLIMIQPVSLKDLPVRAKMQVTQGLYAIAISEGGKDFLLIQDERGGEKGKWELKESKDLLKVEIEGKVRLQYTVKKTGTYIVLIPSR